MEVENFVLKMAAEFPSRRDQLIFLMNNYDMMLSVLMVSFLFSTGPFQLPVCVLTAFPRVSRRGRQTTAKRWRVSSSCSWPGRR